MKIAKTYMLEKPVLICRDAGDSQFMACAKAAYHVPRVVERPIFSKRDALIIESQGPVNMCLEVPISWRHP